MLTGSRRPAKVDADGCTHAPFQAVEVSPVKDAVAHGCEEPTEVGPAKVCARLELGKRIHVGADTVEDNVLSGVHVEALGKIGVDLEELNARRAGQTGRLVGLVLERRQKRLEPLEGAGVFADPDELDTTQ